MAYQNDGRDNANRNTRYFLPLALVAIALVLGFMFLIPDDNADRMNATAPAAGSMTNNNDAAAGGNTPTTAQ